MTLSGITHAEDGGLVFNPGSNRWERKSGVSVTPKMMRSDKSPVAREIVQFESRYKPGSIVIRTSERRLYYVLTDGTALRYGIGVGRDGFAWKGRERISRKAEWPSWTPPEEMRRREAEIGRILPATMEGGPDNPLGARALYLGSTLYRIHGTNQPWTIGGAVSSGCIRMANEDVIDLYGKAVVGALVFVE
ncbi:L,D-transpeptidase [Pseudohoeflea suaedae]|uniref:L,D-transpeptidase n=2 Tax=Pseudohoeflea suaedae TaxID=877384 RepID=A0A4R5PI38_9HYPH|nr:L,D-transpeptidase [Pseudohoeflea suaedae]